jgi:sortase A
MSSVETEAEPIERGRRPRRVLIVATAVLIVGGAGATFAVVGGALDADADTVASFSPPEPRAVTSTSAPTTTLPDTTATSTTTTTSTSTTTSASTTTTTVPLQATTPIAPPSDPGGAEDLGELGSISIPKIGLDASLNEGIRLTTLDRGPGHWPGSAMPGQVGNVVVAAHRTSHGAQFRHIDQLVPGDIVTFTTADGSFDYQVTGTQIVSPDALWIIDPTDTPTATLFACHPPGSTRQRIVVNLALV